MLVDGGGFFDDSFDIGKYVLAPFLWHERIGSIDIVVLSHPHPDHLLGLLFILENFRVAEVWTNGEESDSIHYLSFLDRIREKGIVMKVLSGRTPTMNVSGVDIQILNPHETPSKKEKAIPSDKAGDTTGKATLLSPQIPFKRESYANQTNERSLVMRFSFGRRTFLLAGDISV
jgi:competence protein ComEC